MNKKSREVHLLKEEIEELRMNIYLMASFIDENHFDYEFYTQKRKKLKRKCLQLQKKLVTMEKEKDGQ